MSVVVNVPCERPFSCFQEFAWFGFSRATWFYHDRGWVSPCSDEGNGGTRGGRRLPKSDFRFRSFSNFFKFCDFRHFFEFQSLSVIILSNFFYVRVLLVTLGSLLNKLKKKLPSRVITLESLTFLRITGFWEFWKWWVLRLFGFNEYFDELKFRVIT